MSNEESILRWLRNDFLKHWIHMIEVNKKINNQESLSQDERTVKFPFIPIEADGHTLRNFLALILKYLFPLNPNSLIIVTNDDNDSVLWAAFQKADSFSFVELTELDEYLPEVKAFLTKESKQARLIYLEGLLKKIGISSKIGFYLCLNVEILSDFKAIYENHSNLLEFYSKIWDLMSKHFKKQSLQFFPEPLLFKFFRRLTTRNINLSASAFENFFGTLLPTQNLIITFLHKEYSSSLAVLSKQDHLQLQLPEYDNLSKNLQRYWKNQEKGIEYLNKIIKSTTPLVINHQKVEANVAITLTEDIWLRLQDIMTQYSFEHLLDKIFEMVQEIEEKWSIEQKIVLFRRWGKSFMGFQLHRLIPTQISTIVTSILSFENPAQIRTLWFIINDSFDLLYILGVDFQAGLFNQIYLVTDPTIFELYTSESDKALGVKKVHYYYAENENWINQIIVIMAQDLNLLITFLPLLTSIKGSLKYLNVIENIITYRMYFYPPNFFADLLSRKGATYFFKNIVFPLVLKNSDSV